MCDLAAGSTLNLLGAISSRVWGVTSPRGDPFSGCGYPRNRLGAESEPPWAREVFGHQELWRVLHPTGPLAPHTLRYSLPWGQLSVQHRQLTAGALTEHQECQSQEPLLEH